MIAVPEAVKTSRGANAILRSPIATLRLPQDDMLGADDTPGPHDTSKPLPVYHIRFSCH